MGFIRHDDREVDVVTIVFGQPSMPDGTPVAPAPAPEPAAPVQCPAGSPTPNVPAGQTCAPPPTDSVTFAVSAAGRGKIDVKLTNSTDLDASCAYTAKPKSNPLGILPTINKTVAVKAKGTATLNENSPSRLHLPPDGVVHRQLRWQERRLGSPGTGCVGLMSATRIPAYLPTSNEDG